MSNRTLNIVSSVFLAVTLVGCANVQQKTQDMVAKPSCCKDMASLPSQAVRFEQPVRIELSENSSVFQFSEGKSYFQSLTFSSSGATRPLRLRVFQQGSQSFESMKNSLVACPTIAFLDKDKVVLTSQDISLFKVQPTSFLGPSISEAGVWHANASIPAGATQAVVFVKQGSLGRRNAVPIYRFNQVAEYLYVPCGPTGEIEMVLE